MAEANADTWARDLLRLLNDMAQLQAELAMHMRSKLDAMKRADSDRIQSITAREMLLAKKLQERMGLRRQITRRILDCLGLDPEGAGSVGVTRLAEYFPEPRRSQLLVAAAGLKEKTEDIDRMRVTTTLITQEMLKHLEQVFSVMTGGGAKTGVYSRTGGQENWSKANVFEAVG